MTLEAEQTGAFGAQPDHLEEGVAGVVRVAPATSGALRLDNSGNGLTVSASTDITIGGTAHSSRAAHRSAIAEPAPRTSPARPRPAETSNGPEVIGATTPTHSADEEW